MIHCNIWNLISNLFICCFSSLSLLSSSRACNHGDVIMHIKQVEQGRKISKLPMKHYFVWNAHCFIHVLFLILCFHIWAHTLSWDIICADPVNPSQTWINSILLGKTFIFHIWWSLSIKASPHPCLITRHETEKSLVNPHPPLSCWLWEGIKGWCGQKVVKGWGPWAGWTVDGGCRLLRVRRSRAERWQCSWWRRYFNVSSKRWSGKLLDFASVPSLHFFTITSFRKIKTAE